MHTDRNVRDDSEGVRRIVSSERDSGSSDTEGKDMSLRRQCLSFAMCSSWYAKVVSRWN